MAVTDARVKEKIQHRGEHGIAEIFVMPGHRAGLYFPAKAIAHHHVVALPPHLDETRHFAEVVAVVRVAHDDERRPRAAEIPARSAAP